MDNVNTVLQAYESEIQVIRNKLDLSEMLVQVAEESAELSQAALKMCRASGGNNPTPLTLAEARSDFNSEFADVLLCAVVTGIDWAQVAITIRQKIIRWNARLGELEEGTN